VAMHPANAPGNRPVREPPSGLRSIFRTEALEIYRQNQSRIVLPRFTTPRALAFLWVVAVAFIVLGFGIAGQALIPMIGWPLR